MIGALLRRFNIRARQLRENKSRKSGDQDVILLAILPRPLHDKLHRRDGERWISERLVQHTAPERVQFINQGHNLLVF